MANRLIEELLINVKQKGAPAVERQLKRIVDTVEDAAVGAELLKNELNELPAALKDVERAANKATAGLRGVGKGTNTNAIADGFSSLEDVMTELSGSILALDERMDEMSKSSVAATDRMSNNVVAELERIQDQAEQTGRATRSLGNEMANSGKKGRQFGENANRAGRGVGNMNRQGRNGVRTLSDLVKAAGPLVNAYAAVAANIFAVSEALRLLSEGAAIQRLQDVGSAIGANVGVPLENIAADIREASGGVLTYAESLKQASAAASFGFTTDQIQDMTVVARRASIALGQDFTDALNRAIRGVSKLEVELLDELGITARLTTAYQRYGAQIGVAADNLNAYQQRLALLNEVTRQSQLQLGFLDDQLGAVAWEQAATRARQAFDSIVVSISNATSGLAGLINASTEQAPAEQIDARAEAIRQQLIQSQIQGSRAGIVGAFTEFDKLQTQLEDRIRTLESSVQGASFQEVRTILNEISRYQTILKGIQSVRETNFLGVDDVETASAAYQGLNGAVRGAAADFTRLQAAAKGNNTATETLAQTARSLQQTYEALDAADPYADLTVAVNKLGFESKEALDTQVRLTRALADATSASEGFVLVQAQLNSSNDPEASVKILEKRLELEQNLLTAQRNFGITGTKLLKQQAQVLNTQKELNEARIKGVQTEFNQAATTRAQFFRDINLGNVATLRKTIELEQGRQRALSQIANTEMQIAQSKMAEKDAELQIRDIENQRIRNQQNALLGQAGQSSSVGLSGEDREQQDIGTALSSYSSAISQLTSQNAGLETMITNLNAIAGSFNNIGQSSLNATQLTTVGLNAFAGLLQNVSQNAISAIDQQIALERKRDGTSKASLARIRALEAQKIREQQKAAQKQILISTAVAVMNAAANPWPVPALPLMAAAALAGGLAYSQASTAASNQLSVLNTNKTDATLKVGQRENKVDVTSAASAGELSYIRNERGTGALGSFTPRAAGGVGTPGLGLLVGENGPEYVTPMESVQVTSAEDTEAMMKASSGGSSMNLRVEAIDAQSIIDRAPDIWNAIQHEGSQRGIDLETLR